MTPPVPGSVIISRVSPVPVADADDVDDDDDVGAPVLPEVPGPDVDGSSEVTPIVAVLLVVVEDVLIPGPPESPHPPTTTATVTATSHDFPCPPMPSTMASCTPPPGPRQAGARAVTPA